MTKKRVYTTGDVQTVFELIAHGWAKDDVQALLGLSTSQLANIITRRMCVHVPIPDELVETAQAQWRANRRRPPQSKLTPAEITAIRAARAAGETLQVIAERYGVSTSLVSYIASGKRAQHIP